MKKLILRAGIAIIFVAVSSCNNKPGNSTSGQQDSATVTTEVKPQATKKYELKSGIVIYKSEVMGMNNSQELYFDDFGAKEATYTITELKIMGQTTRKVDAVIIKDGFRYTFELENKMNGKDKAVKELKKETVTGVATTGTSYAVAAMTDEIKKEYEYKDEGKETVAGIEGNKFSMKMGNARMTGVVYKNVMLKTVMEMITITAEKFEQNIDVPSGKFEIPQDYKIIETK